MTKVTITLPPDIAEKLKAECHREGKTASELVEAWVRGMGVSPAHQRLRKLFEDAAKGIR